MESNNRKGKRGDILGIECYERCKGKPIGLDLTKYAILNGNWKIKMEKESEIDEKMKLGENELSMINRVFRIREEMKSYVDDGEIVSIDNAIQIVKLLDNNIQNIAENIDFFRREGIDIIERN